MYLIAGFFFQLLLHRLSQDHYQMGLKLRDSGQAEGWGKEVLGLDTKLLQGIAVSSFSNSIAVVNFHLHLRNSDVMECGNEFKYYHATHRPPSRQKIGAQHLFEDRSGEEVSMTKFDELPANPLSLLYPNPGPYSPRPAFYY